MVEESPTSQSGETMRERGAGSKRLLWVLLDVDRWVLAALLSGLVFVALLALGLASPTPARTWFGRGDPTETLYQALVTSTITLVTLVLTLSQIVLSQELGAAGDQRERMAGALSFRDEVADAVGVAVSPAEPSAFLRALVRASGEQATAFAEAVEPSDPDLVDVVETYVAAVTEDADAVAAQLDGTTFGEFDVIRAALNYNYSWKIYAGRRIRREYDDALSEAATERLDALLVTLELFGPAREHVKTLYFQWELSNLSRAVLYAAVPALSVAVGSLLFLDAGTVTGATAGLSHALVLVAATTSVSLVPFWVLLAYVLRIVTVTKRTLSIGPFILRETDRSAEIE